MSRKWVAAALVSVTLAGCVQPGQQGAGPYAAGPGEIGLNKTTGGGLLGAALGGLAGSQLGGGSGKLALTGLGVVLGGLAGSEVGKSLDRADLAYANRRTQQALEEAPAGHTMQWRNPDSGNYGTVTPTRTYEAAPGRYCREFQQTIVVGGQQQQGVGTACRQPDGSWRITQG